MGKESWLTIGSWYDPLNTIQARHGLVQIRCTRGLMCGRIAGRSLTNGGSSLPSTHAASRRGGNVFCRVNGWCSFLGHMIKTFVCKIVSVVMILKLETLCNKLTAVHHWYKLSRWRILFGGILYIVIRTCFVVENLFCSIYAHEYDSFNLFFSKWTVPVNRGTGQEKNSQSAFFR